MDNKLHPNFTGALTPYQIQLEEAAITSSITGTWEQDENGLINVEGDVRISWNGLTVYGKVSNKTRGYKTRREILMYKFGVVTGNFVDNCRGPLSSGLPQIVGGNLIITTVSKRSYNNMDRVQYVGGNLILDDIKAKSLTDLPKHMGGLIISGSVERIKFNKNQVINGTLKLERFRCKSIENLKEVTGTLVISKVEHFVPGVKVGGLIYKEQYDATTNKVERLQNIIDSLPSQLENFTIQYDQIGDDIYLPDHLKHITGDFNICGVQVRGDDLTNLPNVDGDIVINNCSRLKSLAGMKRIVGGSLAIESCYNLENIDDLPSMISGDLTISYCRNIKQIKSIPTGVVNLTLKRLGITKLPVINEIDGNITITGLYLEDLTGLPTHLKGNLILNELDLKDLTGCPEVIDGELDLTYIDKLGSLDGIASKIGSLRYKSARMIVTAMDDSALLNIDVDKVEDCQNIDGQTSRSYETWKKLNTI